PRRRVMAAFLYLRCNSGHYFTRSSVCPFDGWSAEGFDHAVLAAIAIADAGWDLSIGALRSRGVSDDVLHRTVILEFVSDEPPFEAIDPAGYLIHGEWNSIDRVGHELK